MSDPVIFLSQFSALIVGTFASEDLTCIAAGLFIREGSLSPTLGVAACFLGIYLGDLGLWLIGRFAGKAVWRWKWLARRLPQNEVARIARWWDQRGWSMVFAARFMPGARLPLYIVTGALGCQPAKFVLATLVAALIWTPLLVLGVALLGPGVVLPLRAYLGSGWLVTVAAGIVLLALLHLSRKCGSARHRGRFIARISRIWRWEFWPGWLFYMPLVPWLGWLSLRYRSLTVWTSANPGIPHGGVVGESKTEILSRLPSRWIVPSTVVELGDVESRMSRLAQIMASRNWAFPLVLKPDASQRGAGVKLIRSRFDAETYFRIQLGPVLAQVYHPGPYEAGIFYYRRPDEPRGHIFSICDKQFPSVTGDDRSTLEELIYRHPRFRMQAKVFLTRHAHQRQRVLANGESLQLALAGNHCQGTMFRDGSHLITPELEQRIDDIAGQFEGFCIGRFDVRYTDVAAFRAGRDLAIVELNGVTSESTNLYDPTRSILWAYKILFRQWSLLFEIGNRNRCRGIQTVGVWQLWRTVHSYYDEVQACPIAD